MNVVHRSELCRIRVGERCAAYESRLDDQSVPIHRSHDPLAGLTLLMSRLTRPPVWAITALAACCTESSDETSKARTFGYVSQPFFLHQPCTHLTALSFQTVKRRDLTGSSENSPSSTKQFSSEGCSQRPCFGATSDHGNWLGVFLRRHGVKM